MVLCMHIFRDKNMRTLRGHWHACHPVATAAMSPYPKSIPRACWDRGWDEPISGSLDPQKCHEKESEWQLP